MPFLSIARKDLLTIFRDKAGVMMFFVMPLVFLFLFGSVFGGQSKKDGQSPFKVKVLVSNEDKGQHGAEVIAAMKQVGLAAAVSGEGAEAVTRHVANGDYAIGVTLPPDFSAQLERFVKQPAANEDKDETASASQMRAWFDPAQAQVADMAKGMLLAALQRVTSPLYREAAMERIPPAYREVARRDMAQQGQTRSFPFAIAEARPEAKSAGQANDGNAPTKRSEYTSGDIITPGFTVYFVFFLANSVAASLLLERQEGTLRRMLSAPIARSQILLGKLLARGIIGVLQTLMLFGVAALFLHAHFGSSPFGLALVGLATIFTATGMGLLIATLAKTPEQVQSATTLLLLIMGAISGCLMPRLFLPEAVQKFSYITPHAWALTAYEDLMLRGRPLSAALPAIGVVIGFGVVFYALALTRFRYE